MSKPIFGYSDYRGFAQQSRLLLQYLGVDYEDKRYEYGAAPDYRRDEWYDAKFKLGFDFPNLPYWIDGDVKLTESMAVFKYIARTRGPQLVPNDPLLLAKAEMVEGVVLDVRSKLVAVVHGLSDENLAETLKPKMEELNRFLQNKQYALGDKISYVDFFLYEVLYQLQRFKKDTLTPYENLDSFLKTIASLPQLKEYIKAAEVSPCYGPRAKQF